MKPWQKGSTTGSAGRAWVVALVLFAMLCGLILVVTPSRQGAQEDPVFTSMTNALGSIDEASEALGARNYGELRTHLQRAARRSRASNRSAIGIVFPAAQLRTTHVDEKEISNGRQKDSGTQKRHHH